MNTEQKQLIEVLDFAIENWPNSPPKRLLLTNEQFETWWTICEVRGYESNHYKSVPIGCLSRMTG